MNSNLVETHKVVQLMQPQTTNGGATGDYVSLKNVLKATILVELTQAVGHATLITPQQASAVAGTGVKALTNNTRIWMNEDVAASDTLVKQTDAKNVTVTNDIKNKQIIIEIIPEECMDIANGFDCINVISADSSQATNLISATAILESRYPQATPPAAITD